MLSFVLVLLIAACSAVQSVPILSEQDDGPRYQYAEDSKGRIHLVDSLLSLNDLLGIGRFNPSVSNVYHLFTRQSPTISQPILQNPASLQQTNYDSSRRTAVLIHGWFDSATSDFNSVLVPALLAAEDLNVIVVDWSEGANSLNYRLVNYYCIISGSAVAQFISWLNSASGSSLDQYHIIGHGLGGHQAGIVGRNLNGQVAYITGLDPALLGWVNNIYRFQSNDGLYTEVIHTNYGLYGYLEDLGQVDFYPNGGISMPGCDSNACDHARGFHYLAESILSGGFTGRECFSYHAAVLGLCSGSKTLQMGGLTPKTGESGVYLLETNAAPPFSQG